MVRNAMILVTLILCGVALIRCTAAQQRAVARVGESVCQVIESYDADAGTLVVRMQVMPADAGVR
jgi:hypothetical protein